MVVVVCRARFLIPYKPSLKDKRSFAQAIVARLKSRYNLAVSEVDELDNHEVLTLGFSAVGREVRALQRVLQGGVAYIESQFGIECLEERQETLKYSQNTPFSTGWEEKYS